MERYVKQLIEDINAATWKVNPPREIWDSVDLENDCEIDDISHVEKYVYGKEEPISKITGLDVVLLPPAERLSDDQKSKLSAKLEELLALHHFELDFPPDYPLHMRYSFIRNFWHEEHVEMSFGTSHIEFCDFEEENCPFPGYCNTCKEIEEQMQHDEEQQKKINDRDISIDDSPF
ncbi:MAG: hypothetical protein R6U85_05260 [Salinivirgaceae bacterium]